jgi:hypothetical protein
VSFCATEAVSGATKATLGTTNMVTNTIATFAHTFKVTETTVYTLDSKLMYMGALVARATPITITVEPADVPPPPCTDEYTIDLSASAAEIKTGDTVTATATVKNGTAAVSGTSVMFTKSGVGELKSSTTATTDKDGKAIVTASSTTTGTMTIVASADYCKDFANKATATTSTTITVVPAPPVDQIVNKDNPAKFGTEGTEDYVEVGCTTATTCSFKALCQPSKTPAETHAKAVGYFGCNFTELDATDGEFYIKWNHGLGTTTSVSQAQLLKLGRYQDGKWVVDYDNSVNVSDTSLAASMATVNTTLTSSEVSDTGDYAKLVDNEMIYLPIVFRQLPTQ